MKKPTVLIYSDCYTFGGSEYVVVNILKSKELRESFNFLFAYRYSREYFSFVNKIFPEEELQGFYPIRLLTTDSLYPRISARTSLNKYVRYLLYKSVKIYGSILYGLQLDEYFNKWRISKFLSIHGKEIDMVHINNGGYPAAKSCLLFAICARRHGLKSFMQVNNCADESLSKSLFDQEVESSLNFFLTASEYCRKALASNRFFDINNIVTLHNSVEEPTVKKSRDEVLIELGIKTDAYVISNVALLEYRKGQIPLLQALLMLKEKQKQVFDKICLLLVGNGADEAKITHFINGNQLADNVRMLGYRMDYLDIINASDVFVLPSVCYEDMPLTIMSAMALGKPIVSTRIAGIPEEVDDGVNGYLVDPEKETFVQDLSDSLAMAYMNKAEMGQKSRELFEQKFTRKKYEKEIEQLYSSLIEKKNERICK